MKRTPNALNLRRLATVPRWAVIPTLRKQSVAEHSFHVLWLFQWVANKLEIETNLSFEDALLVLFHDWDESETGDIPGPNKGRPSTDHCDQFKCVLKIADCLEAWLFIAEDQAMGNSTLSDIRRDVEYKGQVWLEATPGYDGGHVFVSLAGLLASECNPTDHPVMKANP